MTYRDANQIAKEWERRQELHEELQPPRPTNSPYAPRRGTLSIWFGGIKDVSNSVDPWQSENVSVQIKDSGVLVTTDEDGDVEVYYPVPGWYVNFVPDRERE